MWGVVGTREEACTGHAGLRSTGRRSLRIRFTGTHWLEAWKSRHHRSPQSALTHQPPQLCKSAERLSWKMLFPILQVRKPRPEP